MDLTIGTTACKRKGLFITVLNGILTIGTACNWVHSLWYTKENDSYGFKTMRKVVSVLPNVSSEAVKVTSLSVRRPLCSVLSDVLCNLIRKNAMPPVSVRPVSVPKKESWTRSYPCQVNRRVPWPSRFTLHEERKQQLVPGVGHPGQAPVAAVLPVHRHGAPARVLVVERWVPVFPRGSHEGYVK